MSETFRVYIDAGEFSCLSRIDTDVLRKQLLAVNGIGPETADDILLYAFERPVFVIDAYTRRIFSRLKLLAGDADYETLRHQFETGLQMETAVFNEYHALIVRHAKDACKNVPIVSTAVWHIPAHRVKGDQFLGFFFPFVL